MVEHHFVAMSPLCIGSLLDFCLLLFFLWVVSTSILIWLILLMGTIPSLIFYLHGFSSFSKDTKSVA
jgi:hypothetical protein